MLRLLAPGAQNAPSTARDGNFISHVGSFPIALELQLPKHFPVTDHLQMINRYDRSHPGSEFDFALARRKFDLIPDFFSAQRESQQRAVGGARMPLLQGVQPVTNVKRSLGNFHINTVQSNRPTE